MDILTSAADAILNEDQEKNIVLTPTKGSRHVLANLTNKLVAYGSQDNSVDSSLNALFSDKITSTNLTQSKANLNTPRKRRKNSLKFGDENEAPYPKTPKSEAKGSKKFVESPVTPLTNLKMLTRIASMEEHIPSKKTLFETPNTNKAKVGLRRCISETTSLLQEKKMVSKPKLKRHPTSSDLEQSCVLKLTSKAKSLVPAIESSRREKSLGLLCERFLDHFPIEVSCLETPRKLVIDDVASVLGTERRRVYDIVNILECLNMASRVQKNMYQWMGKQHLESTLSKLRGLAEEMDIGVHLNSSIEQCLKDKSTGISPGSIIFDKADARKEKSIGILCQKFLMLFLTSDPPHIIQLDTAILLLLGQEGDDLEKLRTRGRRIYDIANVLVSLHLIKKLTQCKSFMYIGPQVEASKTSEILPSQFQMKPRHSLLPPPMVHQNITQDLTRDSKITPGDGSSLKKGRHRKIATEFVSSRAKRNCLALRTKSEEAKLQDASFSSSIRVASLQNICQVDEIKKEEPSYAPSPVPSSNHIKETVPANIANLNPVRTAKTFRFSSFGSPRMALTFQNSLSRSPPSLTNKPPGLSSNVSRVAVRPPIIFHKLNITRNETQRNAVGNTPVYVIQTSLPTPQNSLQRDLNENRKGGFKVYSRKTLPTIPTIVKKEPLQLALKTPDTTTQPKPQVLTKSFTKAVLPSISFNTLSKTHYKTVIGPSSQIPSSSLSSMKNASYRFIINNKDSQQISTPANNAPSNGKDARQPGFVKMFQKSPDNSSTDSELESIFGDSFKFARPKNILNQI